MGTPANSVPFPSMGNAFNTSGTLWLLATGQPSSAGLTGISGQVSINDGAFANLQTAPTEAPADSSILTVDLHGSEMAGSKIIVRLTATGCNTIDLVLAPVNLGQFTGRFDVQSVIRLEQLFLDLTMLQSLNGANQTGAALQLFNPDGSVHFQSSVGQNTTSGTRTITE